MGYTKRSSLLLVLTILFYFASCSKKPDVENPPLSQFTKQVQDVYKKAGSLGFEKEREQWRGTNIQGWKGWIMDMILVHL